MAAIVTAGLSDSVNMNISLAGDHRETLQWGEFV